MSGRVALVTGAARGIGAATVRRLVADGYRVVAVDSCADTAGQPYPLGSRADLESLAALGDGAQVLVQVADVRDRAALAAAVEVAVDRWGRLDAAVAAAAVIAGGQPLWQTTDADLDLLWDVDVRGVWNTAAVTVPALLAGPERDGARFVAVASAAGHHGLYRLAAYTMAKHAVVGLVKGLAADLVGTGVTAAAVSPGSTRTDMLAATGRLYGNNGGSDGGADGGADEVDFGAHQLIGRVLEPEEVAAAIAFCCSREGGVVNGSVLHADGGFRP